MKRIGLLFALTLVLPVIAHAGECPSDTVLKAVGTVQTSDGVITTRGVDIRAIAVNCGGTACDGALYDADAVNEASSTVLKVELGAAANGSAIFPSTGFFDPPLAMADGAVFIDDGNVDAFTVFACRDR